MNIDFYEEGKQAYENRPHVDETVYFEDTHHAGNVEAEEEWNRGYSYAEWRDPLSSLNQTDEWGHRRDPC